MYDILIELTTGRKPGIYLVQSLGKFGFDQPI